MRTPRLAASAGALVLALALSACGVKQEAVVAHPKAKPFAVMLDRPPNGTQAALYAALSNGAFGAAGLAVSLDAPPTPSAPLALLAAGKVDMAISSEPELLIARDHGLALVSIAALVQQPLSSVIALPAARRRKPRRACGQARRHGGHRSAGGRVARRAGARRRARRRP